MKILKWALVSTLIVNAHAYSQDEAEAEDSNSKADKAEEAVSSPIQTDDPAAVLNAWEKKHGESRTSLPKRWLFLQEQAGTYGSPSPLNVDKFSFDSFGWFQLAESEALRLYIQMNPEQKKDEIKPEELPARLKRYADLSGANGIILKTAGESASWVVYQNGKNLKAPVATFPKGPESFRSDAPISWLVSQLNYDAMVVGTEGDYLILAKLRPLKRGAQGVILRKSSSGLVADSEKEIGALLRIVHDSDDYILAKVSLTKNNRAKVPLGSKVLFDQL